jgi:hypothetical protein
MITGRCVELFYSTRTTFKSLWVGHFYDDLHESNTTQILIGKWGQNRWESNTRRSGSSQRGISCTHLWAWSGGEISPTVKSRELRSDAPSRTRPGNRPEGGQVAIHVPPNTDGSRPVRLDEPRDCEIGSIDSEMPSPVVLALLQTPFSVMSRENVTEPVIPAEVAAPALFGGLLVSIGCIVLMKRKLREAGGNFPMGRQC